MTVMNYPGTLDLEGTYIQQVWNQSLPDVNACNTADDLPGGTFQSELGCIGAGRYSVCLKQKMIHQFPEALDRVSDLVSALLLPPGLVMITELYSHE